ncbi:MAG: hypothetical protein MPJ50_09600 [Pirellulales bacterium]|nr:hypothetical protein [Pirellulales bacterium]
MAKRKSAKKEINKSDKIREYRDAHPDATPKLIVEGLGKKGVEVSYALVSNILYRSKNGSGKKGGKGRRGRPPKATVTGADLVRLKSLVDEMGGVNAVKSGLEMLEKLR